MFNPKTTLVVTSEAKLKEYLNATTKGYLESIGTDFKRQIIDTVINNTVGNYIHIFEPAQQHKFREGYSFLTYIDNQLIFVNAFIYGLIDDTSRNRINNFFKSIKFQGKQF